MNAKTALVTIFIAALGGGCGADSQGSGEDDLTQAGKKLVGAYIEQGAGALRALVLTSETASPNGNRFFADINTGIKCITAPCPSIERVEGTFTAGTKTLTLKSPKASAVAQNLLGKYSYEVIGEKLSLSRKGFQQSLEHVESYCGGESPESDCDRQDVVHAQCTGGWTCSPTATCEWSCGGPGGGGDCEDGTVVSGPDSFIASADGKECKMPSVHCLTKDLNACPQFSPMPPDFCDDGTVVKGPDSFIESSDGKECKMPSIHCVTKAFDACPKFSPLPPNFCADGTVKKGPDSFIESSDGKECKLPSIHCLTNDLSACPQF